MKLTFTFSFILFFVFTLFAQEDKVKELVSQGVVLNDEGKYDEAIERYKAALEIDKNSSLANYEMSYTCMASGKYEEAVKYSKKVIKLNQDNLHGAYIVCGSSLDMMGEPEKAIKVFEEGLEKFQASNLLNYNLAITAFKIKDLEKAEKAAINGIICKPQHCSSHLILSSVMQANKQRVKSVLPLYYSLILEPNSKRSKQYYTNLLGQMNQGVERKDAKNINVMVPNFAAADSTFGAAEMMISLSAASGITDEKKSKMESFVESTKSLFSILGELKKENKGIWWDFYVTKFDDLVKSGNYEAFCYYISQSASNEEIGSWIMKHPEQMEKFNAWKEKNVDAQKE
jgi:Uncharacterized enzyme of heme biosynthesis